MKYARLKPWDGKKHLRRTYTCFGIKFLETRGWYKVDDDVAEYLATVVQIETDPESHPAFDIVDNEAAAKALVKSEELRKKAKIQAKLNPEDALHVQRRVDRANDRTRGDLTTKDLPTPGGPRVRKGDSFDEQDDTFPEPGQAFGDSRSARKPPVVIDGADGTEDEVDAVAGEDAPDEVASPMATPAVSDASGLPLRRPHRSKTATLPPKKR